MGFAALGAETACRTLSRLGDLARTQAAGAHPNAPRCAVDERLDRLQVRLETPGSHIVGMGNRPANDRSLPADFTPLCHDCLWKLAQKRPIAVGANSKL